MLNWSRVFLIGSFWRRTFGKCSSQVNVCSHHETWERLKTFRNSPNSESTPQAIQTIRDIPMLPECFRIPFGEMKIPAPIMIPTMTEIPESNVTFFPSSTFVSFSLGGSPESIWCPFSSAPTCSPEDLLFIFQFPSDTISFSATSWGRSQSVFATMQLQNRK